MWWLLVDAVVTFAAPLPGGAGNAHAEGEAASDRVTASAEAGSTSAAHLRGVTASFMGHLSAGPILT
ncbi:hypothetical protein GCM10009753_21290 [Streptantibioticus ferralitis]